MIVPTDTDRLRGNRSLKNYTIAKLGNVFLNYLINSFYKREYRQNSGKKQTQKTSVQNPKRLRKHVLLCYMSRNAIK